MIQIITIKQLRNYSTKKFSSIYHECLDNTFCTNRTWELYSIVPSQFYDQRTMENYQLVYYYESSRFDTILNKAVFISIFYLDKINVEHYQTVVFSSLRTWYIITFTSSYYQTFYIAIAGKLVMRLYDTLHALHSRKRRNLWFYELRNQGKMKVNINSQRT